MTQRFAFYGAVSVALASAIVAQPSTFLFASVVLQDPTVVATLPSDRRWLVKIDSAEERLSSAGESFPLRQGTSLSLIEHHSSYQITCHISPPAAGLQVENTFDAHSFGGTTTKKSYFIKAQ